MVLLHNTCQNSSGTVRDDTWLQSSVRDNFVVSCTRLRATDKAFSIAGPCAWNALASDMKLISSRSWRHFFSLIWWKLLLVFSVLRPNYIALSSSQDGSRAGLRPASELDSVMEFGLSGAIQLASRSQTSSRLELVANQLRTGLRPGSTYLDISR